MKTKVKSTLTKEEAILLKIKRDEEREKLQYLILERTEAKVKEKGSDANLDRLNEIIELRNGEKQTIKSLRNYIVDDAQPYDKMFPNELYREVWRLNGWSIVDTSFHFKPHSVATFTVEVIYGRFYKEVLPELRKRNPYIAYCVRQYKLFQYLSSSAKSDLQNYINDAISIMKSCSTMHEFRVKYEKLYGIPFQYSLFEKNEY